jgi:hypothetical protein
MKNNKTLRILGIALIFSLLIVILPAAPVLGTGEVISISPTSGTIGASITISGTGFSPSTDTTERYARVIFSPTNVAVGKNIDIDVTTYKVVTDAGIGFLDADDSGEFSGTFTIPASCLDGIADLAVVTPGTYYIYVTVSSTTVGIVIKAKATITVTSAPTLNIPSPTSGAPGTDVLITGTNFPAGVTIAIKWDGVAVPIANGDFVFLATGAFNSHITVPAAAVAGTHTIQVMAAGTTTGPTTSFGVTAPAVPAVTLTPTTGAPGTTFAISGSAFPVSQTLTFLFDSAPIDPPPTGSVATDATGAFTSVITVPSAAVNGAHIITVTAGTTSLTPTFIVAGAAATTTPPVTTPPVTTPPVSTPPATTPPATTPAAALPSTPSLNPNTSIQLLSNTDGTLTLIGMDFAPGATVVFAWDSTQMATGVANGDGFVSASFKIPAAKHGEHTILGYDGADWDALTFAVEATPPNIPQPLLPGMGAKIKSPMKFDWVDVTDPSPPVTYNLQISADSNFADANLVINKTGIAVSEYILADDEATKLIADTVYFWRESATDGAQNQSAWTQPGSFTVTPPFKFVGWPMYLTMGGIALVFLLIGLWLGRRTAFYY